MASWTPADWAVFLGTLGTAVTGFYLGVLRPLLTQLTELIKALHENTTATNTSATALTSTATAVQANTVATQAVVQAIPAAPITINTGANTGG